MVQKIEMKPKAMYSGQNDNRNGKAVSLDGIAEHFIREREDRQLQKECQNSTVYMMD